jgi:hypothetical protein
MGSLSASLAETLTVRMSFVFVENESSMALLIIGAALGTTRSSRRSMVSAA